MALIGQAQEGLWSLFRRGQNELMTLERNFADTHRRLLEVIRARKNDLRRLMAASLDSIEVATIRLMEMLRARKSDLRKLMATSLDSIEVATIKIFRFRSQLAFALGQVSARLKKEQNRLTKLGRSFAGKPQRPQKVRRSRENDLRKLLANSPDAIVVTSLDRSFVAANLKARELFGVSVTNMSKFTVDAFLPRGPIPEFDGKGSPIGRRKTRQGKCEVRRLDGSLLVAEYSFIANYVPFRHLYKFCNVTAINQYQPATLRTPGKPSIVRANREKAS